MAAEYFTPTLLSPGGTLIHRAATRRDNKPVTIRSIADTVMTIPPCALSRVACNDMVITRRYARQAYQDARDSR